MNAVILIGLGFGDEGKGTVTDYLCRTRPGTVVVRFCGGAQAAHNVVTDAGIHFCFHQFGSGTLAGARTHLGPGMLVNPITLNIEEQQLRTRNVHDAWDKLTIDETCLITNPFHIAANRLREIARSGWRHGSCGLGINETVADWHALGDEDTLWARDIMDPGLLHKKLTKSWAHNLVKMTPIYADLQQTPDVQRQWAILCDRVQVEHVAEAFLQVARRATIVDQNWWHQVMSSDANIVFEGSQGVLLDELHGFFPHVTRSRTTSANAMSMLASNRKPEVWGIIRTYMTRHGPGPLPTETIEQNFHEEHNRSSDPWQRSFRQGPLDLPLVRYAIRATGGVDKIVLTHMDAPVTRLCRAYKDEWFLDGLPTNTTEQEHLRDCLWSAEPIYEPADTADVLDALEELAPVAITSSGPKPGSKHEPLKRSHHGLEG